MRHLKPRSTRGEAGQSSRQPFLSPLPAVYWPLPVSQRCTSKIIPYEVMERQAMERAKRYVMLRAVLCTNLMQPALAALKAEGTSPAQDEEVVASEVF